MATGEKNIAKRLAKLEKDLSAKDHELEVEAALERIRTVAMNMRSSNELLGICKIMNEELIKLGFDNIRNSQIAINKDDKQLYVNYEYSVYDGGSVTDVSYNSHRKVKAMVKKMKESKNAFFSVRITGKELNEWRQFRSKLGQKKDKKLAKAKAICYFFYSVGNGALGISTFDTISKEQLLLLRRFRNVFVLAYKRFTDLQKAEAQAREVQIQLSLERVRARAMAMYHSDELSDVLSVLFEQFDVLGINPVFAHLSLFDLEKNLTTLRITGKGGKRSMAQKTVAIDAMDEWKEELNNWKASKPSSISRIYYPKKVVPQIWNLFRDLFKQLPDNSKIYPGDFPNGLYCIQGNTGFGYIGFNHTREATEEEKDIILRFATEFGRVYQRFLDLQKAEAQAREARIDAALENVRSRSLAMHKAEELGEVATVVFEKLRELDIPVTDGVAIVTHIEGSKDQVEWMESPGYPSAIKVYQPYYEHPILADYWKAKNEGVDFIAPKYTAEQSKSFLNHIFESTDYKHAPQEIKDYCLAAKSYSYSAAFQKNSSIFINDYSGRSLTEQEIDLVKRFSKVFEQAYVRFLDLQKAEAQAREAQIEVGLERVRSRAMAMQSSEELNELIGTVFTELTKLDLVLTRSIIWIFDPATNAARWWMANGEEPSNPLSFFIKYHEHPAYLTFVNEWKRQNVKFIYDLKGQDKKNWDKILFNKTELKNLPDVVKNGMRKPARVLLSASFNNFGGINVASLEPLSEEHFDILLRFAKVFDLTYTRFNDLKQAETQARKSKIELGLERVRARAMAMQRSDELKELIATVSAELGKLDFVLDRCFINIIDTSTMGMTWWMANPETPAEPIGLFIKYHEHIPYLAQLEAWKERKVKWEYILEGDVKKTWDKFLFAETGLSQLSEIVINDMRSKEKVYLSSSFNNFGYLTLATLEPLSNEQFDIMLRFAKVFDLTYTRFNDLKQAEAQAREAQIEAALERVRSRTMAMHQSEEIANIAGKIFTELKQLDLVLNRVLIWIFNNDEKYISWWSANPEAESNAENYRIDYNEQPVFLSYMQAWQKRVPLHLYTLSGDNKKNWEDHLFSNTELSKLPAAVRKGMRGEGTIFTTSTISDYGLMMVGSFEPLSVENTDIIQRFGRVFQQSYTRYLDVQKAEAQAREAKIEAALERVRSRTMAMHKSEELIEVIKEVFEQLQKLNFKIDTANFSLNYKEAPFKIWMTAPNQPYPTQIDVPEKNISLMNRIREAINNKQNFFSYTFNFEEKNQWIQHVIDTTIVKEATEERKKLLLMAPGISVSVAMLKRIALIIGNYSMKQYTDEENNIITRFAQVFEQSYTRFLDLQQAEAQARESQIQLALERVRARTMAMQKSDELSDAAAVLFQQFSSLGQELMQMTIGIVQEDKGVTEFRVTDWSGSGAGVNRSFDLSNDEPTLISKMFAGWKQQKKSIVVDLAGKELEDWLTYRNAMSGVTIHSNDSLGRRVITSAFFSKGHLSFSSPTPPPAENIQLLERFASVFEQTYTRFLDLQKAEAQARESKIEAALERVRSRTMAMQRSEELANVATVLFQQVKALGVQQWACGFNIWEIGDTEFTFYGGSPDGDILPPCKVPLTVDPVFILFDESRRRGDELCVYESKGEVQKEHYRYMENLPGGLGDQLQNMLRAGFQFPDFQIDHIANFSNGNLLFITYKHFPEMHDVFRRFAKVFEQTYTRFLDLQRAEEQARESQIQLALERVRARTMAMHNSAELSEVSSLLYKEMQSLGVTRFINCGYVEIDEPGNIQHAWMTIADGSGVNAVRLPLTGDKVFDERYDAWKRKEKIFHQTVGGELLKSHIELGTQHYRKTEIDELVRTRFVDPTIFYCSNFSHGYLHIVTDTLLSEESESLLIRFTRVFEMTYKRFLDLQTAEAQARESQIQLALERIRARTMAMQKSEELPETSFLLFQQVKELGETTVQNSIGIVNEKAGFVELSTTVQGHHLPHTLNVPIDDPYVMAKAVAAWKAKRKSLKLEFEGQELKNYNEHRNSFFETKVNFPEDRWFVNIIFFSQGWLSFSSDKNISDETFELLKRFAAVFEQTYIRFNDLKQAEEQSRESQIQLALERVRARTMAMQKSDELLEVISIFSDQLANLNIHFDNVSFGVNIESGDFKFWLAATGQPLPILIHVPYIDNPAPNRVREAQKKGLRFFADILTKAENEHWTLHLIKHSEAGAYPEKIKEYLLNSPGYARSTFILKNINLYIGNYKVKPYSEEENRIFQRFAEAFEQSYTRFLDLQKAEAQARESQIQLALERVRARTMAMQHSDELAEAAQLLYEEFGTLGIDTFLCGYIFIKEEQDKQTAWTTLPDGTLIPDFVDFPLVGDHVLNERYKDWKQKKPLHIFELQGEANKKHHQFLASRVPDPVAKEIFSQIPERIIFYCANFSAGYLFIIATEFLSKGEEEVIIRFAKVFELTYTRFSDLKQAEAQVREAQIEAALEKVRSRSLAMHKSDELQEVVNTVFERLQELNVEMDSCNIAIFNEDKRDFEFWIASPYQKKTASFKIAGDWDFSVIQHLLAARESKQDFFSESFSFEEKNRWFDFAFKNTDFGRLPVERQKYIFESKAYALSIAFAKNTGVQINSYSGNLPSEKEKEILKRFSKVFEQAYIRFLDLQKAEAQAREAQIEAGLERVRARTMAMHSSDDVSMATATMFTELEKLGIQNLRGGITIIRPDQTQEVWSVTNLPDGRVIRAIGVFDMRLHPLWRALFDGKERNDDYQYYWMAGQDKQDYINILNATPNYLVQPIKDFPDIHVQSYFFGEGAVWTNSLQPHSEEDKQIMKRFAGVFGQTYRRYLDLQKAEAQAREAQIEAALEKVRASTMAMQKSEDLSEAAFVLFKQFKELGESPERIFIATFDSADENLVDLWGTNQGGNQLNKLFRVPANEPTVIKKIVDAWKEKKTSVVIDLMGDELHSYLQFLESSGIPVTPGIMKTRRVQTVACFSKGVIGVTTSEPRSAASIQLLERFANVFDLTYTRFLDLLQAEAQAREATIEAALEKVRGKAMAMHNSNDLSATASMIFTELRKLGITPIRCGVGLLSKETRRAQLFSAGDNLALIGWVQLTHHPVLEKIYDTWLNNEEYYPELEGEQMHLYYEQLLKGLPVTPPDTTDSSKQYGHFIPFSIGCLYAWADKHYDDADIRILKRFASIIDLTFRRYIELQKSEANAREAVKQAALDRVRADIASMRTIADLDRITPLIWNELTILNIPFIRCGVFIMDESQQLIHTFLSTPDGRAIAAFHLPYDTPGNIRHVLNNWRNKNKYIDHWNEGEFHQFAQILVQQGALDSAENYLKTIPHGGFYLHFLPFLQGMLYVGNTTQLNDEMVALVQAVADAFSTAYARYEDFNKLEAAKQQVENTLTDLKQAQTQLVQSEKMASLGELTAGIAHEIQNPLNFVNNFSDVSNELLEEMRNELEKGNKEDAIAIVEDVKQNLEKILHHGKRADAIVKGMLQHSRTSSGQKEMTDINSLTDEYLRLAYHGLRAKDKSFNAKFETHFDSNIGKVNIIPQDIGRVILNLINNAFYTVTEKKKHVADGYEPTVTVTTLKDNGHIEIKVKDNGNGIPQKILDKIFQPFFTTKPTGQGTGLGLSLAYDIVTKGHGGELKVETKEGEGSAFIIQLPAN